MTTYFYFQILITIVFLISLDVSLYSARIILRRKGTSFSNIFYGWINYLIKRFEDKPIKTENTIDINSQNISKIYNPLKDQIELNISIDIPQERDVHIYIPVIGKPTVIISNPPINIFSYFKNMYFKFLHSIKNNTKIQIKQTNINGNFFSNITEMSLDKWLFWAAIFVYIVTNTIGLQKFPIYFFTDEAAHMNFASDFIRDGYRNYFGEFLPTYFTSDGWVNSVSVYVQLIPYLLFGKSVLISRLVSAFIGFLGAISITLLIRDTFAKKYYWLGALIIITTPAWFLHARTVFEYLEVASFYSIFLYFYSRYRNGNLKYLYWAVIAGALTFYTHGLGQILISTTALALGIIDFKYHSQSDNRKTLINALMLAFILLLPFIRYYIAHPEESLTQMKKRGSFWVDDNFTLLEKIKLFLNQYFYGLNPMYWYFKNDVDISRHTMLGYGNGLWFTLPFAGIGLYQSIKNIKLPNYRLILVALLACPIPASMVAIGMPRMLWMTIPIGILTTLGLIFSLEWLQIRFNFQYQKLAFTTFTLISGLCIFMLTDSLINGPTWYKDYTLYGMQYGAQQVFQETVLPAVEADPNVTYVVSPSWANGTENFIFFFIPIELQNNVKLGQPENFLNDIKTGKDLVFVMTPNEFTKVSENPIYKSITVLKKIPYPDGSTGFYVAKVVPAPNMEEILQKAELERQKPVESQITINGIISKVIHSQLGSGQLQDIFDNNPDTLARVLEANPFTFDIYLEKQISISKIIIQTGALPNFTVNIKFGISDSPELKSYSQTFTNLPPDPLVNIEIPTIISNHIYIEIVDNNSGKTSQIHVRTIQFK